MSTRQYIGARYVPKFYVNSVDGSAAWESNVNYEPLTFVTLPNQHMYISKKHVPDTVGTPAENIAYWLDMGSFNGFIENLQDEIDALVARVNHLETVNAKKFVFFGDSYAVAYQPGGDEVTPDITGYYDLVISKLGIPSTNYIKCVYGRAGFMGIGTNGKTWVEDLNALSADTEVTDVYVMGGCNDIAYINSGLATAIGNFVATAKTKFPNAKIKIGFCGRQSVNSVFNVVNMRTAIETYKDAAYNNGAIYLSNSENILKGAESMASDHYHPNTTGEKLLANYLMTDILTGHGMCKESAFTPLTVVYDGEATGGISGGYLGYSQTEEAITITLAANAPLVGNFTPRQTSVQAFYPIGTISTDAFAGDAYGTLCTDISIFLADGNNHYYTGYGTFKIENKTMYVSVCAVDNYALFTPDSIAAIGLAPFSVTIPKSQLC